jgi:Tol biopolymer transport system component
MTAGLWVCEVGGVRRSVVAVVAVVLVLAGVVVVGPVGADLAVGDAGVDGGGDVSAAVVPAGLSRGYWMVDRSGQTYGFGAATGSASSGVEAVAVATVPSGAGLWTLGVDGVVRTQGAATSLGNLSLGGLSAGEVPSALSVTPDGLGYWIFTSRGRVSAFGSARTYGDLTNVSLNGPVVASVATPTGLGYYLIGSDGGVFAFGDAVFRGSMGGQRLNQPVVGIAPDPDNRGYWLVAADGGIFAFEAEFRGSMGGQALNRPVIGAVAFGGGYLMVAADGGIFNFSPQPFLGSLGANPPSTPVIGVAAYTTFTPGARDPLAAIPAGTDLRFDDVAISADASTAVFTTTARLVPEDTNSVRDVYSVNRVAGSISLESVYGDGVLSTKGSSSPVVSADGGTIVWTAGGNAFGSAFEPGAGGPPTASEAVWIRDVATGVTTLLTPANANGNASTPTISDDGNVVAFYSFASNLVADDVNAEPDVFVWSRSAGSATGEIRLVSVTNDGLRRPEGSSSAAISGDGSTVAFVSDAQLTAEDTNTTGDVYLRRLATNTTALVSRSTASPAASGGAPANNAVAVSADGTIVAFESEASDLVPGDTNGVADVFVRNTVAGITERVSVDTAGAQGNGPSGHPTISADGDRISFESTASNLIAGDANATSDVMQRVRSAGATVLVSDGLPATQAAQDPDSSADGRTIVYVQLGAGFFAKVLPVAVR